MRVLGGRAVFDRKEARPIHGNGISLNRHVGLFRTVHTNQRYPHHSFPEPSFLPYINATVCFIDIYAFLTQHGIPYQRFDHPAVFTCEQAQELRTPMPGKDTKNLFLRDERGKRHFLVTIGHEKQADIRALKKIFGVQKLSFASPERLKTYLGVNPGAVTILGLVHDPDHAVEVFIDEAVWNADAICCHPLVNTSTLCIPHAGLEKFIQATGHAWNVVDTPQVTMGLHQY